MSDDHAETVRLAFEAFNSRDVERLDRFFHDECVLVPFRTQLEGTTYRGLDGLRRFVRDVDDDWSRFRIDPLSYWSEEDRVMVSGRVRATGGASGVDVDFVAGFVLDFREELIAEMRSYSDPEAAFAASGLKAQSTWEAE